MKIQKFRPSALSLLLIAICLAPLAASAQIAITGIKIKSSGFDPATRIAKLTFINDTPKNITAWGYCVRAQNAPGQTVSHSFCTVVDSLTTVIWYKIESKKRPFLPKPECDRCRLIHPGEEFTVSQNFSGLPDVADATIEVTLIAYEGGKVELAAKK